jgi:hypothetical protein
MLSFLSNWKYYLLLIALLASLSYSGVMKFQNLKLANDNLRLQSKIATYDIASQAANDLRTRQENDVRLREQEAAQARAESEKHKDEILSYPMADDCESAHQFLLERALEFHWNNTIP